MKYTVDKIKDNVSKGEHTGVFGFWGTRSETQKEKSFSNFYKAPMTVILHDGRTHKFECNEQYFMYRKALTFEDYEALEKILVSGLKPKDYKDLGRQVKNYDEVKWWYERYQAMLDGLRYKYTQNKVLNDYLLSTSDLVLVEASPYDRIWGTGVGKNNPNWEDPNAWQGTNYLGFALMELRDELREAQSHE